MKLTAENSQHARARHMIALPLPDSQQSLADLSSRPRSLSSSTSEPDRNISSGAEPAAGNTGAAVASSLSHFSSAQRLSSVQEATARSCTSARSPLRRWRCWATAQRGPSCSGTTRTAGFRAAQSSWALRLFYGTKPDKNIRVSDIKNNANRM